MRCRDIVFTGVFLLSVFGHAANAQETRADELRAKREAKARELRPVPRPRLERILFMLEQRMLLESVLAPPRGLHIRLGGIGEGAGFGAGPAYRHSPGAFTFAVSAAASLKSYTIAEASLVLPGAVHDGPYADLYVRRRDFPQEDFFGTGPASVRERQSSFALRDTFVRGTAGVRAGGFTGGVRAGYLDVSIGRGRDSRMPSTDVAFAPADVPGILAQPAFAVVEPFVEYSTAQPPLKPVAGGRYRFTLTRYSDLDLGSFSFNRWDLDLRQYLPFFGDTRTLALRAWLSSSTPDSGHEVPFYLQPTLGGGYTLRGFRTFRFRDRSVALVQAEYRWRINEFVTGALFYDTGAVARRLGDLARLEKDYGFGFRVGGPAGVAFRTDLAFGSGEGIRLLVRFDNVF